jgi:hypothetical protein
MRHRRHVRVKRFAPGTARGSTAASASSFRLSSGQTAAGQPATLRAPCPGRRSRACHTASHIVLRRAQPGIEWADESLGRRDRGRGGPAMCRRRPVPPPGLAPVPRPVGAVGVVSPVWYR